MSKYRLKSPQRVVEEVRTLLSTTPTCNIYFIDLEFAIHHRHCEAVLDALLASGLKSHWCCQTRADSVNLDLLRKMKRAGYRLVHYGVETGSERVLGMVNKHLELEQIHRAIHLTRKAGLNSACFFMLGFPTETEAEIRQTIRFSIELNPTYASFHLATPYPGPSMYRNFQEQRDSQFIQETYQQVLPLPKLKALQRKVYLEYYLRPAYLLSRFWTSPWESWQQVRLFLNFVLN